MSISRITRRVDQLGQTWEQFKEINERRLKEIEQKGQADPLTMERLNKVNQALDGYKDRLASIETAVQRPAMNIYGATGDTKSAEYGEYKHAFSKYLRKGAEDDLSLLQHKALSVGDGNNSDGGYLVTPHMSQMLTSTIFETSPMRQIASVQTISTDSLEILEDNDEAACGWTTEAAAVTETDSPQIGKKIISVHELYAQPKATQKLIDDSSIDVEAWLTEKLVDGFARKENSAFISGDGVGKPKGILSYAAGTSWGQIEQVDSGASGTVTEDGIVMLYYSLKEEHASHSTFLMNRATAQAVRLLKDSSTDQYLWSPGLAAGAPDTLLGVPVMQAVDMPVPAAGSLSVALGDFSRAYQIVDRTAVHILRDPFTEKPFVKFYATKRVGGDVVNFDAVKLLKLSA